MTSGAAHLFEQALTLSDNERAELAGLLLQSLDREADAEVDVAWRQEIARRMRELDSGAVRAVPWEEAEAMIFGDEDGGADQDRVPS